MSVEQATQTLPLAPASNALDRVLWKFRNAIEETRLNIKTGGVYLDPNNPDSCCSTLSYRASWAVLDALRPKPSDVIVDIGCGKGRFVCCAAQYAVRKVVGVEINPEVCAVARTNATRLRGRQAPVQIIEGAAQLQRYDDATLIYMFNPFGPPIMREVLAAVRESMLRAPRSLHIAYAYPRHDAVLQESGWLERYDFWAPSAERGLPHPVSFWKAK